MLIRKLDPSQFVESYCCQEQMFYPWSDVVSTPFGTGWLVLAPGKESKPHNHQESETFFILRGSGKMTVGAESREVGPGDVIYLPPFGDHILRNTADEDLHFISIWWEDAASVASLRDRTTTAERPSGALVVTAHPAHPGARGPGRNAEIYARYLRLTGAPVRTLDERDDRDAAPALLARLEAAGALATREGSSFFAPGRYADAIREHARRAGLSPELHAGVEEALADDLADLAIAMRSRSGERFDRRFEAAARLLAAARPDEAIVVFLTADEAFTYAVLLPALVAATGSAGTTYTPATLVAEPAPDAPLAGSGAWLADLGHRVARDHDGRAPSTQAWTAGQQRFVGRLLRTVEEAEISYQAATFAPREVLRLLAELVRAAGELAAREAPWGRFTRRQEERNNGVAVELLAAKTLACLAYPLAPEWSTRLWRGLGYSSSLGESEGGAAGWEKTPAWVPSGQPVGGLAELAAAETAATTATTATR